ncbi:acyl-CoA--6-aminopenicillanic acid acyltransferase [Bacteriovorax sp. DB6_IX]|uniref:acyl-CoA--6-aminopenicillanic acid acyltransferase n=1 Tax=Bacteriovorax sp. DB6_IX TaxID=1353530 RepID=UPI00038A1444|nr:acyl-CoA--6-aminopenicillanic acid acyltransferase [Bacteriovorax sp. DB6_IX]EQC48595.1 acyl-coenzyme A:6-aminopenicillanic acid acyl-transferase [Bacteriovorax sp. DB6_IX]
MSKAPQNSTELPVIKLFGEEEECFYQLGLKDKEHAKSASFHIKNLISTAWDPVNLVAHKAIEAFFDKVLFKDRRYERLLEAYAQGSGLEIKELSHALLVPEVCSFLGLWLPKLSTMQFGCSSAFCLNDEAKPVHARILDFPLKGTYDKNERILSSQYKGLHKVMSYSSAGLPFSGLTSMNEYGLSLAVHQKFTNKFNQHGEPIFYLAHQLIHQCKDIDEALEFLKQSQSLTCWNFNLVDPSGRVLEADLSGNDLFYNIYDLNKEGPLYICNEALNPEIDQEEELPHSIYEYNELRKVQGEKKLKKIEGKKNIQILKEFSSPQQTKKLSLSPITVSTMASVLFDVTKLESHYIPAEAPKIYTDTVASITNLFDKPTQKLSQYKPKAYNLNYKEGMKFLIRAQRYFDLNDFHECYHNLQMAIETFEDENLQALAKFYFIVVQYIHEPHLNVLRQIQKDLLEVTPHLSNYLSDVAKILDQRMAILTQGQRYLSDDLQNKNLKKRYQTEAGFNKLAHYPLRHLTFIHIDIMEVIFA